MSRLCFVTTCMGRLEHLKQTLPRVVGQPDTTCIVVDYSCPDRCGDWVEASYPGVKVVRVPDKKTFSRSCAVNAGGRLADGSWICFFDSDVFVDPQFSQKVLPFLKKGYYYGADPLIDAALCGTFICSRADFERIGGYDEVYQGWGEEDFDVYNALEVLGVQRKVFPSDLLYHVPHGDEFRVRFHDNQKMNLARAINRVYRFVKYDVLALTGHFLSLEKRQRLYDDLRKKTDQLDADAGQIEFSVDSKKGLPRLEYKLKSTKFYSRNPIVRGLDRICDADFVKIVYRLCRHGVGKLLNKTGLLPRRPIPLDLRVAIYERNIPFDKRLELRLLPAGVGNNGPGSYEPDTITLGMGEGANCSSGR